ncbi:MAG: amidohydrolase family protein [Flammeovirgaceae bacterium]|jgi:imidazolonepropionase-like amidohydrolase|nr:amidohydrolase family protein [Flammeovirgaceae bacterium]|tara:strand:+ start:4937 stop:6397 length:1461 start_codon:yes stop_codon:yes gene_type:complete
MKFKNVSYLFTILAILLIQCKPSGDFFADALCIQHISIIDPQEGLKEDQTVVIAAGKILKVSPSSEIKLAANNTIIDGTGKFLIPGLWDAHVHFAYIEEMAPSMFDLFLAYGVTSVRDTGGKIEFTKLWKNLALKNPTSAPRVMIAGPLIDGMPNVYDGSDHEHPPLSVGMSTPDDVRRKINELDSIGVDLFKAYEMLSPEQFEVIVQMAKEKGLKVTGHVPLSMDVITASNAGLNSMEHMRNLELSCASNAAELLKERREVLALGKNDIGGVLRSKIHNLQRQVAIENYDDLKAQEVLDVLAKNDTWQIPTVALATGFTERKFADSSWMATFKYIPEAIAQSWKEEIGQITQLEPTPFNYEYTNWFYNMVGKVHKTGISIMAGTDTPIGYLTPGRSLHAELVALVKAGLTPLEAIQTATINPAKYFHMENELGAVKETMWADLLILEANPLDDISNTQKINAVIKQGNFMGRDQLDLLLKGLESN